MANEIELRRKRIELYCKEVSNATCGFPEIPRKLGILNAANVPSLATRKENFIKLVSENFSSEKHFDSGLVDDVINPWPDNDNAKNAKKAYKSLKEYSETAYGALVVKRILEDNKKKGLKRFFIRLDDNSTARAGTDWISLPSAFPKREVFPGGEDMDALAVIHHEFGHTRIFTNRKKAIAVTPQEERLVVINNSNPVRMLNKKEPRYTYLFEGRQTINIITGEVKSGIWSYDKTNPKLLVRP